VLRRRTPGRVGNACRHPGLTTRSATTNRDRSAAHPSNVPDPPVGRGPAIAQQEHCLRTAHRLAHHGQTHCQPRIPATIRVVPKDLS